MALTGQLSDLSLAELIEFFCNQRKTGRLRVSYPRAPGFFYFQKGTMVDAKIGALNGVEAVYYALTLENASFKFSASFEPSRRTIHQPWAQVALEGLRRMDEGIRPAEAFPEGYQDSYMEDVEGSNDVSVSVSVPELNESAQPIAVVKATRKPAIINEVPLSLTVENAAKGSRSMMVYAAIAAAVLLSIAAVGYPAGWYSRRPAPSAPPPSSVPAAELPLTNNSGSPSADIGSETGDTPLAGANDAPDVGPVTDSSARVARRAREARERDRWKTDEVKADPASAKQGTSTDANDTTKKGGAPKAKTTTVQVTYDEAGRVTQASGGDANALRIARQKRFPAGKPGTATVTIPVN